VALVVATFCVPCGITVQTIAAGIVIGQAVGIIGRAFGWNPTVVAVVTAVLTLGEGLLANAAKGGATTATSSATVASSAPSALTANGFTVMFENMSTAFTMENLANAFTWSNISSYVANMEAGTMIMLASTADNVYLERRNKKIRKRVDSAYEKSKRLRSKMAEQASKLDRMFNKGVSLYMPLNSISNSYDIAYKLPYKQHILDQAVYDYGIMTNPMTA